MALDRERVLVFWIQKGLETGRLCVRVQGRDVVPRYRLLEARCLGRSTHTHFVKVDLGTAPPHDAEAGSHGAADHELT